MMRTKSSARWSELPGNWDALNQLVTFAAENEWGIPTMPRAARLPGTLVPYGERRAIAASPADAALHFYLDDHRIQPARRFPDRLLARAKHLRLALRPPVPPGLRLPRGVA